MPPTSWLVPFPYFSTFSTQMYLPSSMQQNTVPLSQCPYLALACEWLKWNMPPDSCLIAHESLYGWANLTLPLRPIYRYSYLDVGLSTALLKAEWYNGTYVLTLPPYDYLIRNGGFELVFSAGLIEVLGVLTNNFVNLTLGTFLLLMLSPFLVYILLEGAYFWSIYLAPRFWTDVCCF